MRVHAFLEMWGLINFQVEPYYKPHKFSLLKESSYSKVLINAANKHYLCNYIINQYSVAKSEVECQGNLFDLRNEDNNDTPVDIDPQTLRKLNILTQKDRPVCAFCNAICGFTWYTKT